MPFLGGKLSKITHSLGVRHHGKFSSIGTRQNPAVNDFEMGESKHLNDIYKHYPNSSDIQWMPLGLKKEHHLPRLNSLERKHKK